MRLCGGNQEGNSTVIDCDGEKGGWMHARTPFALEPAMDRGTAAWFERRCLEKWTGSRKQGKAGVLAEESSVTVRISGR